MTYSDTQLVLLSAASQRDDGLLPRPAKLAGAVLRTFEASLLKVGAAEPVPVRHDQPTWRVDEAETPIGMRITAVGLAALGFESTGPIEPTDASLQPATPDEQHPSEHTLASSPAAAPLRTGTKRALLVELLSTAEGAGIDTLITALGWQAHTVRAALARLRQDGFIIVTTKDEQKRALYRIERSETNRASDEAAAR